MFSRPVTVWFNKSLQNTWEVLRLLRASQRPGEFRILCTHPRPRYPGRRFCDRFEQEPDGVSPDAYVAYCLAVTQRHGVEVFCPGKNLLPLVRARHSFEALGVRLLAAADEPTLSLLGSKADVYATLGSELVALPDYEVVNDLDGFDAAWARLRPRHETLCYKPARSIYGLGFYIVGDRGPALERLRSGDPLVLSHADARRSLAVRGRFPDLLLMQYLPGPERSVDCLARDGELIRCVVRRKEKDGQLLEDNPALVAIVRRLTARLRLSNLFNVQFRDDRGTPYLLEINPRMAGGLPFACRSGVVLPCWALRLALGTASIADVPQPRTGIWVPQVQPVSSL